MTVRFRGGAAVAAVAFSAAAGFGMQVATAAVGQAQAPVCPAGTYWSVPAAQCLADDVNVYVTSPNPVVGPVGPVGVGGVVGPVGPGPVGPGPVGPGPLGPGR